MNALRGRETCPARFALFSDLQLKNFFLKPEGNHRVAVRIAFGHELRPNGSPLFPVIFKRTDRAGGARPPGPGRAGFGILPGEATGQGEAGRTLAPGALAPRGIGRLVLTSPYKVIM